MTWKSSFSSSSEIHGIAISKKGSANMCCDWKAGLESSKARKNWKVGAAIPQELKLQVRRQRVLFTIAWKLLQKDRTAANYARWRHRDTNQKLRAWSNCPRYSNESTRLNTPRNLALTQKLCKLSVIYTLVEWLIGFRRLWHFCSMVQYLQSKLWNDSAFCPPICLRAHVTVTDVHLVLIFLL